MDAEILLIRLLTWGALWFGASALAVAGLALVVTVVDAWRAHDPLRRHVRGKHP